MRQFWSDYKSPITLLILLILLFAGAWWGYRNVMSPLPKPDPIPCVSETVGAELGASKVTVRVYNAGETTGLATRIGRTLSAKGFIVKTKDNIDQDVTKALIIGSNENDPEVKLVAGFFINPEIRGDGRIDHIVDIIVGNDFEGMNTEAPVTVPVEGGVVCLPPTATPTPSIPASTDPTDAQTTAPEPAASSTTQS